MALNWWIDAEHWEEGGLFDEATVVSAASVSMNGIPGSTIATITVNVTIDQDGASDDYWENQSWLAFTTDTDAIYFYGGNNKTYPGSSGTYDLVFDINQAFDPTHVHGAPYDVLPYISYIDVEVITEDDWLTGDSLGNINNFYFNFGVYLNESVETLRTFTVNSITYTLLDAPVSECSRLYKTTGRTLVTIPDPPNYPPVRPIPRPEIPGGQIPSPHDGENPFGGESPSWGSSGFSPAPGGSGPGGGDCTICYVTWPEGASGIRIPRGCCQVIIVLG